MVRAFGSPSWRISMQRCRASVATATPRAGYTAARHPLGGTLLNLKPADGCVNQACGDWNTLLFPTLPEHLLPFTCGRAQGPWVLT